MQLCKPVVDAFFEWLAGVHQQKLLLPSSPFTKAVNYALNREEGLRVFLENPRGAAGHQWPRKTDSTHRNRSQELVVLLD